MLSLRQHDHHVPENELRQRQRWRIEKLRVFIVYCTINRTLDRAVEFKAWFICELLKRTTFLTIVHAAQTLKGPFHPARPPHTSHTPHTPPPVPLLTLTYTCLTPWAPSAMVNNFFFHPTDDTCLLGVDMGERVAVM